MAAPTGLAMIAARRRLLALGAILGLVVAGSASAQERLLSGLKDVLRGRSPAEALAAARRVRDADEALRVMKGLVEADNDHEVAAQAALWVGHYYYGANSLRDALGQFEIALERGDEAATRSEARFWVEQCRSVLELDSGETASPAERRGATAAADVFATLALGDQDLRHGRVTQALRRYQAVRADAERLGCLGPVYYRAAVVLSSDASAGSAAGLDWKTLGLWERATPRSPERALVARWGAPTREAAEPDSTPALADTARSEAPAASLDEAPRAAPPAVPQAAEELVYVVQLGAFQELERARDEMERLTTRGLSVRLEPGVDPGGVRWYRIRLGREATRDAAEALAQRLCGGLRYDVVALPARPAGGER